MTDIVYLNGRFIPKQDASISILDRGFLLADGIYEVIPVYAGKVFRLGQHLRRLAQSLQAIHLDNPNDDVIWEQILTELVAKNSQGNLSIYLQVTRGAPEIRDHQFPTTTVQPTVLAMCTPLSPPTTENLDNPPESCAITLDDIRWSRCDIKSISLLPNLLLRQQAIEAGAHEALLIRNGEVTEGAASNVFIVKDHTILTPPLSNFLLGGITRDIIIELAKANKIPLKQTTISAHTLSQADEIWVTSSTKEVVPIVKLDDKPVGSGQAGPMWRRMAEIFVKYKQDLFSTGGN
ncbi:MAG: D-amino acid aminotransferase [Gammaproteobacteria bacterium]|nr:MAG: D-amino acid aminotransferase [Gammaproteobacteria bacterium]